MTPVLLPTLRMECARVFPFSIFEMYTAAMQAGRDNKSVFEQESELSFFVLVRPLWAYNGGVTAWPNQSRDRRLLALLENNKEKKSSYFFRCEKEGGHLFKELCQEALQIDYPYKFLRTNLLTLENSSQVHQRHVTVYQIAVDSR